VGREATPEPPARDRRRRERAALSDRGFLAFGAVSVAVAVLFVWAPGIDLAASALVYREGEGFHLARSAYARAWYVGIPWLRTWLVAPGAAALLLIWAVRRKLPCGIRPRAFVLVLATLVLGWGLLVNEALKNHVGRARPDQVTRFGGTRDFTPAFVPADQCERNCSFVSGHAAFVFGGFALALMARRRRAATLLVALVGAMAGIGRMLQGAHWLSDIVFGGVLMYAVAWLLHRALFRDELRATARPAPAAGAR
jgi:lipid A 4'-phosphatase